MISQLRKNERLDGLKNDVRAGGIQWAKYIYFALLGGIAYLLFNFFFGQYLFFNAPGIVIKKPHTIAGLYTARVKKVHIKRGDVVVKGQRLMTVESAMLLQQLAQLSNQLADLTSKTVQMKSRAEVVKRLIPVSVEHAALANQMVESLQKLQKRNLVPGTRMTEALRESLDANSKLSELTAEQMVLEQEVGFIEQAREDSAEAFANLKALYNKGQILAPIDGIVGSDVAAVGDVLITGKPMLTVYSGEHYVMAFLPENYLFTMREGSKVEVQMGPQSVTGVIDKLLPVAAALPKVFQSGIKPVSSSQLVRILLPKEHPFVISQKIKIRGCGSLACRNESISETIEELFKKIRPLAIWAHDSFKNNVTSAVIRSGKNIGNNFLDFGLLAAKIW